MIESGIYIIRCLKLTRIYIGSAEDLERRKRDHFNLLKRNQHQYKLQKAFNLYGIENFTFEVLEYVEDRTKLLEREQYYLDTLLFAFENDNRFYKLAFNINRKADSRLGVLHSKESKIKMSNTAKQNYQAGNKVPWNKGLTKDSDVRVKKLGENVSKTRQKIKIPAWNKGRRKIRIKKIRSKKYNRKKKHNTPCAKAICIYCNVEKSLRIITKYHNKKCIHNPHLSELDIEQILFERKVKRDICIYYGFESSQAIIKHYHNEHCYQNPSIDIEKEKQRRKSSKELNKKRSNTMKGKNKGKTFDRVICLKCNRNLASNVINRHKCIQHENIGHRSR